MGFVPSRKRRKRRSDVLLPSPRDMIDWDSHEFHPVVEMPDDYTILDLSGGTWTPPKTEYSVGKYDELRPGLYSTELFSGERFLHIGIDIGAPVGTPCMAFTDGEISHFGYNPADGDYGHVVITKHILDGTPIWALYGHLDAISIEGKSVGQKVNSGEGSCWMGAQHEKGGWEPHLHFQLSFQEPKTHDMPGVVAPANREEALQIYPDPRLVLGAL